MLPPRRGRRPWRSSTARTPGASVFSHVDRSAVRPSGRDRARQPPLPVGVLLGAHAEAPVRRTRGAAQRRCSSRGAALRGGALQPRSIEGDHQPASALGRTCTSIVSCYRSTRSCSRDRSPTSPPSCGVAPADAMLDLALAENLETEFRWRTESPEWSKRCARAAGPADAHRHVGRRRPPGSRRRRRLELVLLALLGARSTGVDAGGRDSPDHAGACGAARSCTTGAPSGSAAGPT